MNVKFIFKKTKNR